MPGRIRSGADDEVRTRGLDHGKVALCPLSYTRKGCKAVPRPVPKPSCAKLLKSNHRMSVERSNDRRCAPIRAAVGSAKNQKARILSESGPLKIRARRARLGGTLSRMQQTLVPIEPLEQSVRRMRGNTRAVWPHRHGTRERSRALDGSGACDEVPGYHDEAFRRSLPIRAGARTVKSLYSRVNPHVAPDADTPTCSLPWASSIVRIP